MIRLIIRAHSDSVLCRHQAKAFLPNLHFGLAMRTCQARRVRPSAAPQTSPLPIATVAAGVHKKACVRWSHLETEHVST